MLCCFDVTVDDDGRAPTDDANQLLVARAIRPRVAVGKGSSWYDGSQWTGRPRADGNRVIIVIWSKT